MKRSKFTDAQIIEAIKRVEAGLGVPELCRELGISSATFYKWRSKYGGMDAGLMSRMKDLEAVRGECNKLANMPDCTNVKALVDHEHQYRLRVGNFRVFFDFDGAAHIVSIEEVKKRDERTY